LYDTLFLAEDQGAGIHSDERTRAVADSPVVGSVSLPAEKSEKIGIFVILRVE
jgi:hypothetical protein